MRYRYEHRFWAQVGCSRYQRWCALMIVVYHDRVAHGMMPAGGIGVIGGMRLTPKILQQTIDEIKEHLEDKNAPFGVDLLIPQIGGNARKTNVSLVSEPSECCRILMLGVA